MRGDARNGGGLSGLRISLITRGLGLIETFISSLHDTCPSILTGLTFFISYSCCYLPRYYLSFDSYLYVLLYDTNKSFICDLTRLWGYM